MKPLRLILIVVVLFAGALVGRAAAQDVAVVVNKANATEALTVAQLRKLLLSEETQLGGKKAAVFTTAAGRPDRGAALKAICGMSEIDFNTHFMQAKFKGEAAEPPRVMASAAALKQAVAATPGGIGLILLGDVDDSVKVVKLGGVAPGQPGYAISTK
jgi:phosphate transport system substrate-binding protein